MSDTVPPEMLKGAEDFANAVLAMGKGFGFTRHLTNGKTRSAVVGFMCDDHPLAAALHRTIKAACSEADVNGTAMGFNKDATLNTLLG